MLLFSVFGIGVVFAPPSASSGFFSLFDLLLLRLGQALAQVLHIYL